MSSKFPVEAIWYKCLVCQRCFQYQERLIAHKKNTKCGSEYPKLDDRGLLSGEKAATATRKAVKPERMPYIVAYLCVRCNKIIRTFQEYKRHVQQHRNVTQKRIYVWNKMFPSTRQAVYSTEQVDTSDKTALEEKLQWNKFVCKRRRSHSFGVFRNCFPKIEMKSLSSISTKTLRYSCYICVKKFRFFSSLHYHCQDHKRSKKLQ